jgi:S-adenosylmethionine/arginine decarboxylase-like enzyme
VAHSHLTGEFVDVPVQQLTDAALLSGLLIAAASSVGLSSTQPPTVRQQREGGVSAALVVQGSHIIVHALPEQRLLLFDILTPASHDFRKALDVFSRRLTAREVHSDTRTRG